MIVYEKGKPKRADYRKFKIKSVEGPNDYASMKEVLSRRFLRGIQEDSGFERLPDLIMMDGGRGQVNIAPVSYTHLDVYKRQECGLCGTRQPPGAPEPPHHSADDQSDGVGIPVLAICVLQ